MIRKIKFYSKYKDFKFPLGSSLKLQIEQIFSNECIDYQQVIVVFCDDEYLLNLNKVFLNHDFYTDILTFNLAPKDDKIDAEIYISIDRVKENAQGLRIDFNIELHRMIFHGILHLCGYTDQNNSKKLQMHNMEDDYLRQHFTSVSRETIKS